jgi:hypothetical protein
MFCREVLALVLVPSFSRVYPFLVFMPFSCLCLSRVYAFLVLCLSHVYAFLMFMPFQFRTSAKVEFAEKGSTSNPFRDVALILFPYVSLT